MVISPIDEALHAVRAKLRSGVVPAPLQPEDVILLLKTVFSLTYFHHGHQVYQQIAGLPMGCSVSGLVAIVFIEATETRALATFARCIYDTWMIATPRSGTRARLESSGTVSTASTHESGLSWSTAHRTQDHSTTSLSLLDLTIRIDPASDPHRSFDFYTKDTKQDVFLHRDSALPWAQKTQLCATSAGGSRRAATGERHDQHECLQREAAR